MRHGWILSKGFPIESDIYPNYIFTENTGRPSTTKDKFTKWDNKGDTLKTTHVNGNLEFQGLSFSRTELGLLPGLDLYPLIVPNKAVTNYIKDIEIDDNVIEDYCNELVFGGN